MSRVYASLHGETPITPDQAEKLARVMWVVADPARLQILARLARGKARQRDLIPVIGLTQTTVLHHMKVLAEAGLVAVSKAESKAGIIAPFAPVTYRLRADQLKLIASALRPAVTA